MINKSKEVELILDFASEIIEGLQEFVDLWCKTDSGLNRENVKDKFVAETALLVLIAGRIANTDELHSRIAKVALQLSEIARTERHLEILSVAPQSFIGLAMPHIILQKLGYADDDFDEVVKAAHESRFLKATDRPNFRQMEMRWLCAYYEGVDANFDDLMPSSLLCANLHPIFMRREDAYAITHAAMYLTDFGRREFQLKEEVASSLSLFVAHTISWCLAENDWDLLAEVLMVGEFFPCTANSYTALGHMVLRDVFLLHESIPGPNHIRRHYESCEAKSRRGYILVHGYHSTFVYGILRCICKDDESNFDWNVVSTTNAHSLSDVGEAAYRLLAADESYHDWLLGVAAAPFLRKTTLDSDEIFLNAKIITASRSGSYVDCLNYIERNQDSGSARIRDSCSASAEKVMQHIRAKSYKGRCALPN